jgi:hypothetical protein
MAAGTNLRGNATGRHSHVEEDGGGCDGEDSKPSPWTGSAPPTGACPVQEEVVQEEAMGDQTLSGWTHAKFEPDCQSSVWRNGG